VDRLFVEASGMADPSSMEKLLQELTPLIQMKYHTDRSYCYKGSICMVDAGHFLGLSEYLTPVISQVRKSSLVVLNKMDTVTETGADQVEARIHEINPAAPVIRTSYADLSDEILREYLHGEIADVEESSNEQGNRPFGGSLYMPAFAGDLDVEGFLRELAPRMIRMKGFFYKGKQLYFADCVGEDIKIEPSDIPVDELANEIVLIADTTENLSDYINETMKKYLGEDLSKAIFLPN
jgi:G3E family GTPase